MADILLGIPSKGRLQEKTVAWFADRGVRLKRTGSSREYAGHVEGIDGVTLVLLSASEIPQELDRGRIHLGVTGRDLVEERGMGPERATALAELGFGQADLVVAVPKLWLDVTRMDDLDAAAAAFRATHGFRLRVATKYHRLTRLFFADHGVADYQLVDSQGATEGAIKNRTAEAISDITTTGETLFANHLKILDDGLILKSQAVLWRSALADWAGRGTAMAAAMARLGLKGG